MGYYLGIDLGGTNLRAAIVNGNTGEILQQRSCLTLAAEGQQAVIQRMARLVHLLKQESGVPPEALKGIGLGVPGTPDIERGVVLLLPNLPGQWRNVPLAAALQELSGLPVILINDVRAMTLAEWQFGAGKGVGTLACYAIGTGIGGGLVINGRLHLGLGGTAGELGHQVVEIDGPRCSCGGRGCLELYASGPAIAAMGAKAVMHGHTTRIRELAGSDLNAITAQLVGHAAQEGDGIAVEILERAGRYLGIAVANVIGVISPQRVVFGGGVSLMGDLLLNPMRRTIAERQHVIPIDQIEFVQASLGLEAGLVGAALWAKRCYEGIETHE